jgi:hypothetical protein
MDRLRTTKFCPIEEFPPGDLVHRGGRGGRAGEGAVRQLGDREVPSDTHVHAS